MNSHSLVKLNPIEKTDGKLSLTPRRAKCKMDVSHDNKPFHYK
jgi:hypothetical protein